MIFFKLIYQILNCIKIKFPFLLLFLLSVVYKQMAYDFKVLNSSPPLIYEVPYRTHLRTRAPYPIITEYIYACYSSLRCPYERIIYDDLKYDFNYYPRPYFQYDVMNHYDVYHGTRPTYHNSYYYNSPYRYWDRSLIP